MADFVGGIRHIGPSYPVRPVQPVPKERPADNHQKKRKPQDPPAQHDDDDDDAIHIDEHV